MPQTIFWCLGVFEELPSQSQTQSQSQVTKMLIQIPICPPEREGELAIMSPKDIILYDLPCLKRLVTCTFTVKLRILALTQQHLKWQSR